MPTPYRPEVGLDPNDPIAKPNYQNTPEGRSSYLEQFKTNPSFNQPLFDSYLSSHPNWTQNTDYWGPRLSDPDGTGSNAPTRASQTRALGVYNPTADLNTAGPQTSDTMRQIMEELQAQQQGGPSPMTRRAQMRLLGE